jgi:hypothetical protein
MHSIIYISSLLFSFWLFCLKSETDPVSETPYTSSQLQTMNSIQGTCLHRDFTYKYAINFPSTSAIS